LNTRDIADLLGGRNRWHDRVYDPRLTPTVVERGYKLETQVDAVMTWIGNGRGGGAHDNNNNVAAAAMPVGLNVGDNMT
jgi:hypothetical protein